MAQFPNMIMDSFPTWELPYCNSYKARSPPGVTPTFLVKVARCKTNLEASIFTQTIQQMAAHHSNLAHPNLNLILQLHPIPHELPAVVQQYHPNKDILTYMACHRQCDVLNLIIETARGLAYLHQNNIIHGNVHPDNIVIDNGGAARLTDIGINRLLWDLTRPGQIPHTLVYKPAEELDGEESTVATMQMDVYAFASTIYQILTGDAPYRRSRFPFTRELKSIIQHGHITIPRPPLIPVWMWAIIQACWARDPGRRPSMAQVVHALEHRRFP